MTVTLKHECVYRVSQKSSPPSVYWQFLRTGLEFSRKILHIYWLHTMAKLYRVLIWPFSEFRAFNNASLKWHGCVKIMNNDDGWYLITKFSMLIPYCLLNLPVAWNLIIFNNDEVIDVLKWPPHDFHVIQYNTIQYNTIKIFVKRRSTICPGALTELCKRLSKQECL